MKEQCGLTAQGEALPNAMDSIHRTASTFRRLPNFAIGLYEDVRNGTILPATAKSVAGIGVPFDLKRTNTRQRVFLCAAQ